MCSLVECLPLGVSAKSFICPGEIHDDWYKAQRKDPPDVSCMEDSQKPTSESKGTEHSKVKLILREWIKLKLRDGVL